MPDLNDLIRSGALIPVQIYGGCGHPDPYPGHPDRTCDEDDHFSYGLCDRFGVNARGGSDCNRAELFLLRPSDALMNDPQVEATLRAILDDPEWKEHMDHRTVVRAGRHVE